MAPRRSRSRNCCQLGVAKGVASARSLSSTLDSRCPAQPLLVMPQAKPAVTTCLWTPCNAQLAHYNLPQSPHSPTLCGRLSMKSLPLQSYSVLLNSLARKVLAQGASAWFHCRHKHGYESVTCSHPRSAVSSWGPSSDTMMLPHVLMQASPRSRCHVIGDS